MPTATTDSVFQHFTEQGWNEESKLALLTNWLDQTPENERTNKSLFAFLQEQADEENGFNDDEE